MVLATLCMFSHEPIPGVPALPIRVPSAGADNAPDLVPCVGPVTHRHQELQRAHVVALGLLQLTEHAHAQTKLLVRVLGTLVAHGGR